MSLDPSRAPEWYQQKRFMAPLALVALFFAFSVGVLVGDADPDISTETPAAASTPESTVATTPAETPEVEDESEPPPEPQYNETPGRKDFELEVKTLEKTCFGSAGCHVTFRVKLGYTNTVFDLDPGKTYEVTYEVRGAEDPIINTLEVTGDSYSTDQEEFASTRSSDAVLSAVVTDVSEA